MKQPQPLGADSSELRLIAKRLGLEPSRLAGWLADPANPKSHMSPAELKRLASGFARIRADRKLATRAALVAVWPQIQAAIDIAVTTYQNDQEKGTRSDGF